MADVAYEIIHKHYADATAALAGMNDQNWAYEESGKRIMVMDGVTARYYYDSDYIDANFIQNQNGSTQNATFDINGDADIGGILTAGQITSTGVLGSLYQAIFGFSIDVDGDYNGVNGVTVNASSTKNDTDTVVYNGIKVVSILNTGGSNTNTTITMYGCAVTPTSITGVTVNLMDLAYGGATKFHVSPDAVVSLDEAVSTPSNPSSDDQIRIYTRNGNIVFQYNDGGTVRYKYLDMTGTGVTWTHNTTAP